jgi:hypothetical protein
MHPKTLEKLTPDEAALLPVAARLAEIVREYAALLLVSEFSNELQVFWDTNVAREIVRRFRLCELISN